VELALQTKGELRLDPNKGALGENAKKEHLQFNFFAKRQKDSLASRTAGWKLSLQGG